MTCSLIVCAVFAKHVCEYLETINEVTQICMQLQHCCVRQSHRDRNSRAHCFQLVVVVREQKASGIGVIRVNPDQSKHLETATFRIDGNTHAAKRPADIFVCPGNCTTDCFMSGALVVLLQMSPSMSTTFVKKCTTTVVFPK